MAVQPGVWGIDIGQCALKAVRLQLIDNKVTATAFDYVEHPKILSQPDADPEQLTREALEKFLSRNPMKGDKVAIGVPGQSGLARFVKLPPVEESKVADIVAFEAKQQIPFPLEEVVWDYQKVSDGIVEGGFAIDAEIGLFAMKRDMISRFLNHFVSVNVEVHIVQMAPLALCNYITYDLLKRGGPDAPAVETAAQGLGAKKKSVVALDVGTDGSNLIITDAGKIIWQRPIPIGGNHFTRALTKELKLTFAKAEHLKRNAAKSPELANILKALKPVLTDFVGEVQRSLGYFTNTHRDAQVEYLVGLGSAFKLPGLQKYLGDKLQIRVDKPTKFSRLVGESVTNAPVFMENVLTFPVAFGLALQGLGVARLGTNLLPPEITWERKIRAKKPWVVAAAACLMIGTGVLAYGSSVPNAVVNDPKIPAALKKADDARKEAGANDQQISGKQGEVTLGIEKVQAIIAGKDERLNWMRMNEFINNCLPMPGPEGNMKGDLEKLWNNAEGGARATEKYFDRIKKGVDPKIAFLDDDLRQALAAVDVEAVYCRFTKDLPGFLKNAKDYCYQYVGRGESIFIGMDQSERQPMMEETPVFPFQESDGGWAFEIRGTTWYDQGTTKGPDFLARTLLTNLKNNSKTTRDEAIRGRMSHVFLYNTWKDENPRPDTYHFIQDSLIEELLLSGPDSTGAPISPGRPTTGRPVGPIRPGIPPVGPVAVSGGPWTPISKGFIGSAAQSSGGGAAGGGAGYRRSRIEGTGGPAVPVIPGKKDEDPTKIKTKVKPRYEFVIVFIWRESTPSDRFLKVATPGS